MKLEKINKLKKYNLFFNEMMLSRIYLGLNKLKFFYLNSKYIKGFRNKYVIFDLILKTIFLKSSLKLIFKYHKKKKKIFFVGFPNKENRFNQLFINKKHFCIDKKNWIKNIVLNKFSLKSYFYSTLLKFRLYKKKKFFINYLFKLLFVNIKPELIVTFSININSSIRKELIKSQIPSIGFLNSLNNSNNVFYKVFGGFHLDKVEKLCYLLIKSVLSLPKI